jgi:hypothetical protein
VREELSEFVRRRSEWPSRLEFERAGRKGLRDAVGRLGGPERWAPEFGLPLRDLKSGSKLAWTPERIELELRAFLAGCDVWPPRRELRRLAVAPCLGRSTALTALRIGRNVLGCHALPVPRPRDLGYGRMS